MKVAAVLFSLMALATAAPGHLVAPAAHLVRTPQFDSAVIKSDRLGGNFAYSTVEAQAYAAVQPVVQNVITPVGVSYHATPVVAAAPAHYAAAPAHYAAAPVVAAAPAHYAAAPAHYAAAPLVHHW